MPPGKRPHPKNSNPTRRDKSVGTGKQTNFGMNHPPKGPQRKKEKSVKPKRPADPYSGIYPKDEREYRIFADRTHSDTALISEFSRTKNQRIKNHIIKSAKQRMKTTFREMQVLSQKRDNQKARILELERRSTFDSGHRENITVNEKLLQEMESEYVQLKGKWRLLKTIEDLSLQQE